MENTTTNNSL